jgi:hypothetical protein
MGTLPPEFLLVVIGLVFALAGALGVWLVRYITGRGKSKPARSAAAPSTEADELSPDDGKELLRVSRTKAGELVVFVQSRHYHHLRGITDRKVGRETVEAINTVQEFAAGLLPTSQRTSPQASPASPQPAVTPGAPRAEQKGPARRARRPSTPPPLPEKPVAGRGAPARKPGNLLDPLTFVEDIDELVKRRIQERPDLAGRFVHLEASPGGGIRIYVDRQVFEGVGDVTDPQVRAIIQDAIREWEGGYSGSA